MVALSSCKLPASAAAWQPRSLRVAALHQVMVVVVEESW